MSTLLERRFEKTQMILEANQYDPDRIEFILGAVQAEYGYLPEEVLYFVADELSLAPAKVFGVATGYACFSFQPRGKYVIRVCNGAACRIKKAEDLIEVLYRKLGLGPQLHTTPDRLFSLEPVDCLGACGLAALVIINDRVYPQMTAQKVCDLVDRIKGQETLEIPLFSA